MNRLEGPAITLSLKDFLLVATSREVFLFSLLRIQLFEASQKIILNVRDLSNTLARLHFNKHFSKHFCKDLSLIEREEWKGGARGRR